MDFPRILQAFFLRDVASYLIPGCFALTPAITFGLGTAVIETLEPVTRTIGSFTVVIAALSVLYVLGYLISTIMYIPWEHLASRRGAHPAASSDDVRKFLSEDYGPGSNQRDQEGERDYSDRIISLCHEYVRIHDPVSFVMNIERIDSMKNFEVGIAGSLLVWALASVANNFSVASWTVAVVCLAIAAHLFFRGSVELDKTTDQETISAYLRAKRNPASR